MRGTPVADAALNAARQAFRAAARALERQRLVDLFASDRRRFADLTFSAGPLTLDLSRLPVDRGLLAAGSALADAVGFDAARALMLQGGIANPTEGRCVLHTALRASQPLVETQSGQPVAGPVLAARAAMARLCERLRADQSIDAVVHVGIGGSYLGPQLVLDALSRPSQRRFDVRFLANIDGEAFERAVDGLNPARTLLLIASKSWTTLETRRNATLVERWLATAGVDGSRRRIAITARPDLALADGYDTDAILPFADWVGGRFSVWSGIGLPVALALGFDIFEQFLHGAEEMDRHFANSPCGENLPALAAITTLSGISAKRPPTRAVFAYDQRLALLVPYLQQLEMESLGKRVDLAGRPLREGAPAVWGGVGTDAQHAVFQWLHHGIDRAVAEFVLVRTSQGDPVHHRSLLANALAQAAALTSGVTTEAVTAELRAKGMPAARARALAAHKTFPGNRPSALLVLDDLGPAELGALLAFYEHRTAVLGWLLGINPFDQWGVELGKVIATDIEQALAGTARTSLALDPATTAWIAALGNKTRPV